MNWGGFAGGFAQGFNQTFDSKGLTRYMLSDEYQNSKAMSNALEKAQSEIAAKNTVQNAQQGGISGGQNATLAEEQAPSAEPAKVEAPQPAATTPPPVEAAGATTPGNPAPETATTGSGIKAIVSDQAARQTTPQSAPETTTPAAQPVTQQAMARNGGVAVTQPKAEAKPETTPVESLQQRQMQIAIETFRSQGQFDMANKLQEQFDSKRGREAVELFSKGWNELTVGNNPKKAVTEYIGKYYNKYVNDGIDFVDAEFTNDGQILITTKRKDDGTENKLPPMSRGTLLRLMGAHNPVKYMQSTLEEAVDAEKQGAKTRADIAKEDRTFNRDIEKMTIKDQLDAANIGAKERRQLNSKIEALRGAGYSQDFINGALPSLLGIGDYRKGASPEEARRLAHSDRMKNDRKYAKMGTEDQRAVIDKDMLIIYAGGKPTSTTGAGAPATPAATGLPNAGGKGTPYIDTKTGKMIYR